MSDLVQNCIHVDEEGREQAADDPNNDCGRQVEHIRILSVEFAEFEGGCLTKRKRGSNVQTV